MPEPTTSEEARETHALRVFLRAACGNQISLDAERLLDVAISAQRARFAQEYEEGQRRVIQAAITRVLVHDCLSARCDCVAEIDKELQSLQPEPYPGDNEGE